MDLKNAKVIVTGASTGIGFETAKLLIGKGAKVVICSRNKNDVEWAASEIGALAFVADVSNEDEIKKLTEFAIDQLGGLNVLINNAGIATFGSLTETSIQDFEKVWNTNAKGAFMAAKEAATYFKTQNYGNIINIASTASKKGFANGTAYCASKFAMSGMTECWREELRKFNVRVMQVNPSEVITPFYDKMNITPKNIEKKLKPSEIAHTIIAMLEMHDVGFITDATVWATNPS